MYIHKVKIPKENEVKLVDKTPNGFPRKFFVLSIVGSSRSGKTTCQVNLIEKLAPAYSAVCIFTPSIEDPIWSSLKRKNNVYISHLVSNHVLNALFEKQRMLYRTDKTRQHILIVIDDYGILARQTGNDPKKELKKHEEISSGIKEMLDTLYSRARHSGISLMCSFHDTLQMTPLQRVNNTHVILYRLNMKQYEKIAPELRCHLTEREFIDVADRATKEPYSFLYIDLKTPKNEDVFTEGKPSTE
ncbi:hypothetical protein BC832DRAFT_595734 [Gaertneriomyces semiglobifer]|nr:hypothetical protein BC832DRAFT_595734 [Gaertneriomyces semiglobifer]